MPPEHEQEVPTAGDSLHAAFPGCSPARLYLAAVRTLDELGFPITGRDDARTWITFRTGVPTRGWPTQQITANIIPTEEGARVAIGGARLAGYGPAVANWHQAKSQELMFLDRLTSMLPRVADPAPRMSAQEQLRSLSDLRDQGVLTEEEFAAAKGKLD